MTGNTASKARSGNSGHTKHTGKACQNTAPKRTGGRTANARETACRLLERAEKGAYSNIALDREFSVTGLDDRDKALAARLFYGVCERRVTLEHLLGKYLSRPVSKLDSPVRNALLTGTYQLLYMDSVPDSAAVNEAVELVRVMKKSSAAGMVNAVLRSIIRDGKAIPPVSGDFYEKAAVEYSCPAALIRRICEGYGRENCISLLEYSLKTPAAVLRANTLLTSGEELAGRLREGGVNARVSDHSENAVVCHGLRDIDSEPCFRAGLYHVQDFSSQLCCMAVSPKPSQTVIDLCAAPGGKSFTMAQMMNGTGRIFSCELHEKRTGLIRSGAKRLGLDNITAVTCDGRVHDSSLPEADAVLCDVPCSGYGVMGRKPEIRLKPLSEADSLPEIQLQLLRNGSAYVKKGGILVYSTCTVNINENEGVAEKFLAENPGFEWAQFPDDMGERFKGKSCRAVFPGDFDSDGFFIARMRRRA